MSPQPDETIDAAVAVGGSHQSDEAVPRAAPGDGAPSTGEAGPAPNQAPTPDTSAADQPTAAVPDADQPTAGVPDAAAPGQASTPETVTPGTPAPESAPDAAVPETPAPEAAPDAGVEATADASAAPAAPLELEPGTGDTTPRSAASPDTPTVDDAAPVHESEDVGPASTPTEPAGPSTVAELVAATLRSAGVRIAFTVPGESFLPLLDALAATGIRIVATRHEGAAALAAEAYGQLTGRPAACLGTRVVGAANLAIGIHTATADSTPMFAVVGQVSRGLRGREAFQEADLVASIGGLAKWAGEIDDPAAASQVLGDAVRATAEGRPGPALLVVPEDVLGATLPDGTRVPVIRPRPEPPSPSDVRAVLHFLAAAERPVILAGAGVLRARCSNDLVRLAELLHVPVIASWRRGDVISNDHPLYLGMTGFGSPPVVARRLEAADALLVLGSRLNEPTTSGYRLPIPGQRWIHVDLEPRELPVGSSPAPWLAIRADARSFVRAAVARLKDAVLVAEPITIRDRHNAEDRAAWEAATVVDASTWDGPGVHPGRIVADLRRLLPEDAILTTDAGSFAGWAARGFRFQRPGTFLGPTSGAMGYGLPAALAAGLVHRERRVVALVGDGGLGMTLAELETAVREEAHVVVVVFDNERYGMIRAHQEVEGSPTAPGTDLGPVDFAAVARACGARGIRVETDGAFEPALRTALAASGPSVIQVVIDRRWVSVDEHPGVVPDS